MTSEPRRPLWNVIQDVLGSPDFKRELYRSVLRPPGRLLDFGCATGHIAEAFLEFDYYGIDIDPKAIHAAKEKFKTHPSAKFSPPTSAPDPTRRTTSTRSSSQARRTTSRTSCSSPS